ncbi:hypothetical protein JHW43_001237 [Diplocarpon mali]|nr:hypothetical protein JHW43_001237 [Diplocarpon mali]
MSPEWLKASRPIFKIWVRRPNLATPDPQIAADFMEERGTKNSSQPQSVVMGEIYASGFFMASLGVRGAYRAESFPALKYLPLFLAQWKREIEHARSEADANMALIDDVKRSMVTANEKGQAAAPSVVPTLPAIQEEEANPPRGYAAFGHPGLDNSSSRVLDGAELAAVIGSGRLLISEDEANRPGDYDTFGCRDGFKIPPKPLQCMIRIRGAEHRAVLEKTMIEAEEEME